MTFAQFLVSSLLGITIYSFGFHRGLKQGHALREGRQVSDPKSPAEDRLEKMYDAANRRIEARQRLDDLLIAVGALFVFAWLVGTVL